MNNRISIINYGLGNLRSVENAVKNLNFDCQIINNPNDIDNSDKIILPGVGSFKTAMKLLNDKDWTNKIKVNVLEKGKKILGICLGMQLLGTQSEEFGLTRGFNFIEGEIKYLKNIGCKKNLPQIGWNSISIKQKHNYLNGIPDNTDFYFVNSLVFQAENQSNIIAKTNYGVSFPSIVAKENIFGTQFHPEKSSKAGLKLLENFLNA